MVECLILVGRPMQVKNDNGEIVAAEKNNSQELGHGGDELYDCLVLAAALLCSGLQGELKLDNERLRAQIKEALLSRLLARGSARRHFWTARFKQMRKKRRLCGCAPMSPNAESSCNTHSMLAG